MKKTFICRDCNGELIFRCGEINRPHFAHKAGDTGCSGGESAKHALAKFAMIEFLSRGGRVRVRGACHLCKLPFDDFEPSGKKYVAEYPLPEGCRADVAVLDDKDTLSYVIEIMNTHRTDESQRESLEWCEVSADEVLTCYSRGAQVTQWILTEQRTVPCETCNISIKDIALELGYVYRDQWDYFANESVRELKLAMCGYSIMDVDKWQTTTWEGDCEKRRAYVLWKVFLSYSKCMRCEKPHECSYRRPYCLNCYKRTKRDEDSDDGSNKSRRAYISNAEKQALRRKFAWLRYAEGGWGNGSLCSNCGRDSADPTNNCIGGYAWYFGDKKNVCEVCLDVITKDISHPYRRRHLVDGAFVQSS